MIKPFTGKFAAFAAAAVLALAGCKQEGDVVTVNVPNNKQEAKVTYVLQVMDASGMGNSGAAIQGATLRYFNSATGKFEDFRGATDGSGNLVLTGIAPGSFAGTISATDFGSVNFVADLTKGGSDTAYTAISRITMFPRTAALKGKVYANYAMNGQPANPNSASDVKEVDLMLTYKLVQNGSSGYPMGNGPGRLVNVSIDPMSVQTTQGEGASSAFQFDQVYATESGMLQANLSMVPKRFTTTGSTPKDSIFTLSGGSPRNMISVNLFRNTQDEPTDIGNLLAKPTVMP